MRRTLKAVELSSEVRSQLSSILSEVDDCEKPIDNLNSS